MIRTIFILIFLSFLQSDGISQLNTDLFSFNYRFAGLGSNTGTLQPTIRINGTKLIYTYEQNSYFTRQTLNPDTICIVTIRLSSLDSILSLTKDLKDSSIYETNPCRMSGGIHFMSIVFDNDTTRFDLHNTFHRTALKISEIINQYLPDGKRIWATEQDIIDCENCWVAMRKRWKEEKE